MKGTRWRCPHCQTVRPSSDFRRTDHGRSSGREWRRCPRCGRKGSPDSFEMVDEQQEGRAKNRQEEELG